MERSFCIVFVRRRANGPMDTSGAAISAAVIAELFNDCFLSTEATVLIGGAGEPFFEPGAPARIYFREDFVRSALHEIAHWCVAGERRRLLPDYGYWYAPDGRTAIQQAAFFSVEARPQAIESLFCDACGVDFSPSVDNVEGGVEDDVLAAFAARVTSWRSHFLDYGLPARAAQFRQCLTQAFVFADDPKVAFCS